MRAKHLRHGLTLTELLLIIAILGVLIGLLLPAVQCVRGTAMRTHCANNLRQIGLALHLYHDSQRSLPPGMSYREGNDPYPFMSWNTRLLPFLEQQSLWMRAEEAFAQDKNFLDNPPHTNLATVLPIFSCPADPQTANIMRLKSDRTVAFTDYLGVEGTNQYRRDGVLFLNSNVHFADITDGTSHTLCVGERPPSADGVLGWWYAGWGQSQDGSGDMVLGVREYNVGTYGIDCLPGPYAFGPGRLQNQCDAFHFWSLHLGGGAHFLFADDSVHFLSYGAAPLLPALATRASDDVAYLP